MLSVIFFYITNVASVVRRYESTFILSLLLLRISTWYYQLILNVYVYYFELKLISFVMLIVDIFEWFGFRY